MAGASRGKGTEEPTDLLEKKLLPGSRSETSLEAK